MRNVARRDSVRLREIKKFFCSEFYSVCTLPQTMPAPVPPCKPYASLFGRMGVPAPAGDWVVPVVVPCASHFGRMDRARPSAPPAESEERQDQQQVCTCIRNLNVMCICISGCCIGFIFIFFLFVFCCNQAKGQCGSARGQARQAFSIAR